MLEPEQTTSDSIEITYLFSWGGRSDSRVWAHRSEGWRFVTSILIHASVSHLVSNFALITVASWTLERRYGWYRIAPLYFAAGIAGNIWSATYEQCAVVIGASGAAFGLVAAMLVDQAKSGHSMRMRVANCAKLFPGRAEEGLLAGLVLDLARCGRVRGEAHTCYLLPDPTPTPPRGGPLGCRYVPLLRRV